MKTPRIVFDRKVGVAVGALIVLLVSIDLLMSRQILSYTNETELVMFILTVFVGYGIGSWILLGYTKK
jgi:glucose-6-phosphate-specific signal transduction histidine kinase